MTLTIAVVILFHCQGLHTTLHYTVERTPGRGDRSIARPNTTRGNTTRCTPMLRMTFEPAVPHLKRSRPCGLWTANKLYLNPKFTSLQQLKFKYKIKFWKEESHHRHRNILQIADTRHFARHNVMHVLKSLCTASRRSVSYQDSCR